MSSKPTICTSMPKACVLAACASALALSHGADAAIIVFTNQFVWDTYAASSDGSVWTEPFDGPGGIFPGSASGTLGGVSWNATAPGGVSIGGWGLTTVNPEPLSLAFGGSSLRGVGGHTRGIDAGQNLIPAIVQISLQDGTTYIGLVDAAAAFVGFYSTDAAITGMTISAQALPGGTSVVYPAIDDMSFAIVPAPGAAALLGLAGLARSRRR